MITVVIVSGSVIVTVDIIIVSIIGMIVCVRINNFAICFLLEIPLSGFPLQTKVSYKFGIHKHNTNILLLLLLLLVVVVVVVVVVIIIIIMINISRLESQCPLVRLLTGSVRGREPGADAAGWPA